VDTAQSILSVYLSEPKTFARKTVLHSLYATMSEVVMANAMAAMDSVVDQVDLPDTQDTVILEFQSRHPFLSSTEHSSERLHPQTSRMTTM